MQQTEVLAAKERIKSLAQHIARLEEKLAVASLELNEQQKQSRSEVAKLREQLAARDRRYDDLLTNSDFERKDANAKQAELKTEVENKARALENAVQELRYFKDSSHIQLAQKTSEAQEQAARIRKHELSIARLQEQLQSQTAQVSALRVRVWTSPMMFIPALFACSSRGR